MKMFRQEQLARKLLNSNVIAGIEKHVFEKYHCAIKLCFPVMAKQQKELHFILSSDKVLDLQQFAELVKYIRDRVDFDNIFVQSKGYWGSSEKLKATYSHEVDYASGNKEKIELFINTHYPHFSRLQQLYKQHGVPSSGFEEDDFDEMLRADFGGSVREVCDTALQGHDVVNEEVVAKMFVRILEKAGQCGLDTEKIVSEFKQLGFSALENK
jgi:hypothetical protein